MGTTTDNGDSMRVLGSHGALGPELAVSMRRAVGFRNVLVHEYVAVSDEIVLARLSDLTDLGEFARAIATWLQE